MDIKNNSQKALVLVINLLIVILIVFGIKEANKGVISAIETSDTTSPVSGDVLQAQSNIATDRENKLRKLNNSPKTVAQSNQSTTTINPQPVASLSTNTSSSSSTSTKTPSRKTKTS